MADEPEPLESRLADLARRLQALETRPIVPVAADKGQKPSSPSLRQAPARRSTALEVIDAQIASSSPRDAYLWIQVRAEILRQDEFVSDRVHLRTVEKLVLVSKVGLSALALCGGIGLAFAGFGLPAFVCLGAGLYALAPNFIDAVAKRVLGQIPRNHG